MNKKRWLIVAFAIIFIVGIVISGAYSVEKIDSKVKKAVNAEKKTRVIVTYNKSGEFESRSVNAKELKDLEENSSVEKVEYDYPIHASLQDSVSIIEASETWNVNVNNVNLNGTGQGICILDTGVNYNLPDLGGCFGAGCKVIAGYDFVNSDADPIDDSGHGTHVAGIAAASGGISGVAKGANIIAIKVLDNNGDGITSNLVKGINWCVNNASLYNISVISMSLGTDALFESNCDSSFSTLVSAINKATLHNITIVAASGNSGDGIARNTTAIASPACITNATAIAATDKDDSIASYSHYNSLVKLFAPGTNINSTNSAGGYIVESGTSMATPHAAGAYAIASQLLRSEARNITSSQLTDIFRNNAKTIDLGYKRINVYDTIVDLSYESLNLTSPDDGNATKVNVTFICNITSYTNLSNVTLYLWNSTGLFRNYTNNISGLNNGSNFTSNFTAEDDYVWNCLFGFNSTVDVFAAENYSIRYDLTAPGITVNSPLNNSWRSGGIFNISLNENGSCLYEFNNTNYTLDGNNSFYENIPLEEGSYNVTYYCNDSAGNSNNSEMYFFDVELITPNVSSISPSNGYSTTNTGINFDYNASDNINVSLCSLYVDGANVGSNLSSIGNSTNTITSTLSVGTHSWSINCTDISGNTNSTENRTIIITSVQEENNNGGGGGGGGGSSIVSSMASVYSPTQQEVVSGYSKSLKKSDSVIFLINAGKHNLTLSDVQNKSVTLTIRSDPIILRMSEGEEKKINLSSLDYYDLYIKVDGVNTTSAEITIRNIYEKINENASVDEGEIIFHAQNGKINYFGYWIVLIGGIIIGCAVMYYYLLHEKVKKALKRRKNMKKRDI